MNEIHDAVFRDVENCRFLKRPSLKSVDAV